MSNSNPLASLEPTTFEARPVDGEAAKTADADGHPLFECLGVGGMGEVYRCGDDVLCRDLAIKILKPELRGDDAAEQRFLREARLTSSLQHPGIVPIHHLRRHADGRPCYTMKLVRGRTLAELLRDESAGPERLPRLLAILERVCLAVAFAHSKGIIHRDLKPSNVMVGAFGEVQVMDWGLAKELRRDEPAEAMKARAEMDEAVELSWVGAALGTPAYMPPEQALGVWELVDERADVFALGAVLCEVLTGRPPYYGASREELLQQAQCGDGTRAQQRLEQCGADAALAALCRVCLATERADRPRHAGVVAERLAAYQAEVRERLRLAELERARAEVKAREERKRRRLLAVLALAGMLLLAGAAAVWWQGQRRRAEADGAVAAALAETRLLRRQAQAEPLTAAVYDRVVSAAAKAVELARTGGASAEMQQQADDLLAEVIREEAAAAKDVRLLAALLQVHGPREGPKYRRDRNNMLMMIAEPTAEQLFASAFRAWGLDVDAVPAAEAAARLKARPAVVVMEVIAALDEWASERFQDGKWQEGQRVAQLAAVLDENPTPVRREVRDILARSPLPLERALAIRSTALRPVPVPEIVPMEAEPPRLRHLAEKMDPSSEPVLGLLTLTRALRKAGESALAERLLRAALIVHPREVVLYHTLGQLLAEQKPPRWAEAEAFHRAARALRPDLGVPLAKVLLFHGRGPEGQDLLARLVHDQPDNPYLHFLQGYAWYYQGKAAQAETAYRKVLALQPEDFAARNNLAGALYDQGKFAEAESACRKIIALNPNYALGFSNLGNCLYAQGKFSEAEKAFRKAITLQPNLAAAYTNLGTALHDQGKVAEAEKAWRKAIALNPEDAIAYSNLGALLLRQSKIAEAEAACRKAIALQPGFARAHYGLGNVLFHRGQLEKAEAAFRKAIAFQPDLFGPHFNLGVILLGQGRVVEAEAAHRKAIALKPDFAEAHCHLGAALQSQGRFAESLTAFRHGHELGSKQPGWVYPSLQWLQLAERLVELEKKLTAILQGDASLATPDDAATLAWMCQEHKKLPAAAARLYADAFSAEPKLAADLKLQHRYTAARSAVRTAAAQGKDARPLPDRTVFMFRRWALRWLRDELSDYARLADPNNPAMNPPIQQRLAYWRREADLASVRDPQALNRLSGNERAAWQALWRDVDELAKRLAATQSRAR